MIDIDMKLRIIITGGTFDKHYDELKGTLTFKNSHLPKILEEIRCTIPVVLEVNQLIDSLDMNNDNRQSILESCKKSHEKHIIITHGTDTMAETARVLGEAKLPKTIILTGAMIPYAIKGSDAIFNLGGSIAVAQHLDTGVYIIMNGKTFLWNNVHKNRTLGVFETNH